MTQARSSWDANLQQRGRLCTPEELLAMSQRSMTKARAVGSRHRSHALRKQAKQYARLSAQLRSNHKEN